jgi:hypothetical protein
LERYSKDKQSNLLQTLVNSTPKNVLYHWPLGHMLSHFLSLIYKLLCEDRVIIRQGWKSLQGTNTLAYNKNEKITNIKSFTTLVAG